MLLLLGNPSKLADGVGDVDAPVRARCDDSAAHVVASVCRVDNPNPAFKTMTLLKRVVVIPLTRNRTSSRNGSRVGSCMLLMLLLLLLSLPLRSTSVA